ncbi:hypothetical protein [Legionella septentrionalis]|uniref:Uncharacterized protein n=1 Tax=Legionella septentrionalis TaxID=2498109 RepID=A0A433JI64_9GAMM|nr:hypothetical protein [Legionella septentrionalis]RUQ84963.1 hypothetical protein EKM59_08275 [Legionella septentrionalis]
MANDNQDPIQQQESNVKQQSQNVERPQNLQSPKVQQGELEDTQKDVKENEAIEEAAKKLRALTENYLNGFSEKDKKEKSDLHGHATHLNELINKQDAKTAVAEFYSYLAEDDGMRFQALMDDKRGQKVALVILAVALTISGFLLGVIPGVIAAIAITAIAHKQTGSVSQTFGTLWHGKGSQYAKQVGKIEEGLENAHPGATQPVKGEEEDESQSLTPSQQ